MGRVAGNELVHRPAASLDRTAARLLPRQHPADGARVVPTVGRSVDPGKQYVDATGVVVSGFEGFPGNRLADLHAGVSLAAGIEETPPDHGIGFTGHAGDEVEGLADAAGAGEEVHQAAVVLDLGCDSELHHHQVEVPPPLLQKSAVIARAQNSDEGDRIRTQFLLRHQSIENLEALGDAAVHREP